MRIIDWSSDVCSSDLPQAAEPAVGISAAGDFVVAWVGFSELGLGSPFTPLATDGLESRVYSQRFTADCRKRGGNEIGRASCRERVCQYVSISVVVVSLHKKGTTTTPLHSSTHTMKYISHS